MDKSRDERTELAAATHLERHNTVTPVPDEYKDATALGDSRETLGDATGAAQRDPSGR